MGSFSLVHWIVLAVVAILLLGGGRFSNMMGDVAKGIKQFKKGMAEDDDAVTKDAMKDGGRIEGKRAADSTIDATTREGVREDR